MLRTVICVLLAANAVKAINDPLGIFCGSSDCYEVLGISRAEVDEKSIAKSVKKAYRKMSLVYHPDKNKDDGATEMFRLVARASEVLSDEEQRELYDYYLDHPSQYYKVSGVHFYKSLPQADVRFIVAGIVVILSILVPILQHQRHEDSVRLVREGTPTNMGGSVTSLRVHQICLEKYRQQEASTGDTSSDSKARQQSGNKASSTKKLSLVIQDPLFAQIVRDTIGELSLEGTFRKPGLYDVLLVQILIFPYTLLCWLSNISYAACASAVWSAICSIGRNLVSVLPSKGCGTDGAADGVPTSEESFDNAVFSEGAKRRPKKQKKEVPQALKAGVMMQAESRADETDSQDDEKTAKEIEDEKARISLLKLLLARVAGNSKKKQAGKNELHFLPFSKAEIKSLCTRIEMDAVYSFLGLVTAAAPSTEQSNSSTESDPTVQLCRNIKLKLNELEQLDQQFPSSILELGVPAEVRIDKEEVIFSATAQPAAESVKPSHAPPREWCKEDLSLLARALGKYPGGTRQRWVCISNAMNEWIKSDIPFTPDECTKGANTAMKHLVSKNKTGVSESDPANNNTDNHGLPDKDAGSVSAEGVKMPPSVSSEGGEWSQAQQTALERGMLAHRVDGADISERWALIAEDVEGKTAMECLARFTQLRNGLRAKKQKNQGKK